MNCIHGISIRKPCSICASVAEQSALDIEYLNVSDASIHSPIPDESHKLLPEVLLTGKMIHILLHSLGLTRGTEMYRNHFCTGSDSTDHVDCMALVEAGYMTRRANVEMYGGDDLFHVTETGKIRAQLEASRGGK